MTSAHCPCGSGKPLVACCGPYLDGHALAPSAEALMRSRYTAYVLLNEEYLLATWHPASRPDTLALHDPPQPKWFSLTVERHEAQDAEHAIVEFVARYRVNGRAFKLHEVSRFMRESGRWLYVGGDVEN